MRVFTRGDMGRFSQHCITWYGGRHQRNCLCSPETYADGSIPVNKNDIIINLPYVPGCGMWFDHHISEEIKLKDIGPFKGSSRWPPVPPGSFMIFTKP